MIIMTFVLSAKELVCLNRGDSMSIDDFDDLLNDNEEDNLNDWHFEEDIEDIDNYEY